MAADDGSGSGCDCGCGPTSGEPLKARQLRGRPSPWSTVTMVEAAVHGACLPTGLADSLARTVRPRPAPASLLSALLCPQPEHTDQRGCRAGVALRVARDDVMVTAASAATKAVRVVIQATSAGARRADEHDEGQEESTPGGAQVAAPRVPSVAPQVGGYTVGARWRFRSGAACASCGAGARCALANALLMHRLPRFPLPGSLCPTPAVQLGTAPVALFRPWP